MKYNMIEAAKLCNRECSHIRRLCYRLKIGKLIMNQKTGHRNRLLSQDDMDALVIFVQENGSDARSQGRRRVAARKRNCGRSSGA